MLDSQAFDITIFYSGEMNLATQCFRVPRIVWEFDQSRVVLCALCIYFDSSTTLHCWDVIDICMYIKI